eukprot:scaffold115967_cov20-Tisochrysis_lutea.AAC.2
MEPCLDTQNCFAQPAGAPCAGSLYLYHIKIFATTSHLASCGLAGRNAVVRYTLAADCLPAQMFLFLLLVSKDWWH